MPHEAHYLVLAVVLSVLTPILPLRAQEPKTIRVPPAKKGLLPTEKLPGKGVWVQPNLQSRNAAVTIWFEDQFLGDGKAYERRAKEFANAKRRELRQNVVKTLKALNDRSYKAAKKELDKLQQAGEIKNLQRHWIVNGFTCAATADGIKALRTVKGVRAIFNAGPRFRAKGKVKAKFYPPKKHEKFNPKAYKHPWYSKYLLAQQTWQKLEVTGKGTLNVVHDFNFIFPDNFTRNLYRNPKEVPGNGKDDDGNRLIDDYHGYNFTQNAASLTLRTVPAKKITRVHYRFLHGSMCAAIICGTGSKTSPYEFGMAPEGKWAGVICNPRGGLLEKAIEWAAEHEADTYSMSFSIPNLGEYRSHWRKVMEHGSFCGIYFVSGAGNFAQSQKVPVQMRTPEDIPDAVFAATGVQRTFARTPFSSKGPVQWKTHFYNDGLTDKPEVCAFNNGLPILRPDGNIIPVAISGNSFAGPMLAGSLALMLSADPDLLPWDARTILTSTATDVAKKGFDHETGHGLINCYRAVKEVLRRKAVREGKNSKQYQGREDGDTLDVKGLSKKLRYVLVVASVQPGSQAARLKLQQGDVFVSYDGKKISDRVSLMRAKRQADLAGTKKRNAVIERNGKRITVQFGSGPLGVVPASRFNEPVFE